MLVDAISNPDRYDTKLFHLVCPTPNSRGCYFTFHIHTTRRCIFGRTVGPKIIMTDDCAAERKALAKKMGICHIVVIYISSSPSTFGEISREFGQ